MRKMGGQEVSEVLALHKLKHATCFLQLKLDYDKAVDDLRRDTREKMRSLIENFELEAADQISVIHALTDVELCEGEAEDKQGD